MHAPYGLRIETKSHRRAMVACSRCLWPVCTCSHDVTLSLEQGNQYYKGAQSSAVGETNTSFDQRKPSGNTRHSLTASRRLLPSCQTRHTCMDACCPSFPVRIAHNGRCTLDIAIYPTRSDRCVQFCLEMTDNMRPCMCVVFGVMVVSAVMQSESVWYCRTDFVMPSM